MKKFLCKVFGHRWNYFLKGPENLRFCSRCKRGQAYKQFIYTHPFAWVYMVQRTKLGAKNWMKENNIPA